MTQKKDYEIAIDDFETADKAYREFAEKMRDGTLVAEIATTKTHDQIKQAWQERMEHMSNLIEERNAKLEVVKLALRPAVVFNETQWRGVDGRPSVLTCGRFTATSVTHRGFDADNLFHLAEKKGLLDRVLSLQTTQADGTVRPVVMKTWDIDYASLLTWLKSNDLKDILEGAYDEKESTPQVKGPKPVAMLGDEMKK
jgi:hypothetical protein